MKPQLWKHNDNQTHFKIYNNYFRYSLMQYTLLEFHATKNMQNTVTKGLLVLGK